MEESRWLRNRILAALSVPALSSLAACSGQPIAADSKPSNTSEEIAARDSLCQAWLKGRSFTWCTTTKEAQSLGHSKAEQSLQCPTILDAKKVEKALNKRTLERGSPRRTDIILLHEKTKTATDDCQKNVCCYVWAAKGNSGTKRHIIRGRPLLEADANRLAPLEYGNTWAGGQTLPLLGKSLPASKREMVAAFWEEAALAEHASVASFSRATLELLAVGAPAELVQGTSQGALDEVDHTARCFRIARAYGSQRTAPGPLPITVQRPASISDVAHNTFVEGCVVETIAALEAVVSVSSVTNELLQRELQAISDDEVRHAELAWSTLSWLLTQSKDDIKPRILEAYGSIRERSLELDAGPDDLKVHGILPPNTRRIVARRAWTDIIDPALTALGIVE